MVVAFAESAIVEPLGARRGALSHAATMATATNSAAFLRAAFLRAAFLRAAYLRVSFISPNPRIWYRPVPADPIRSARRTPRAARLDCSDRARTGPHATYR